MTENPDQLKTWQARTIGILTFGGSVLGCGLMVYFGVGAWPRSISYRHFAPAYAGDSLECGGTVTAVDVEAGSFDADLWVRKLDGTVTTRGSASFGLPPRG